VFVMRMLVKITRCLLESDLLHVGTDV